MFFKPGILIILILFFPAWSLAGEGRYEDPWSKGVASLPPEREAGFSGSAGRRVAEGLLGFYQHFISPVDGDRCPCYPSCSQYGREAIRKHGALVGGMMAFGRLLHESDEIRRVPLIPMDGTFRYYDPVENNDFWWSKSGQ